MISSGTESFIRMVKTVPVNSRLIARSFVLSAKTLLSPVIC
ncbi:hypothetical protein AOG2_00350 [Geobacter sp. AOG2]|nr:hypothetical protein AOG2_00350 [Geobacter sp. AOG2]